MAKESLSSTEVRDMMIEVARKIIESEPILTDADRALGDGDHGVGMERGMKAVKEKLDGAEFDDPGQVFLAVGMAMMSSMGGASGALFGTFFRAGGKATGDAATFGGEECAAFFKAGSEGVMSRGGAQPGAKTMVDALLPASQAAQSVADQSISDGLTAVAEAAEAGMEASKDMVATMGRAKTLGEKSVGLPDAGAISVALIIGAMRDFVTA